MNRSYAIYKGDRWRTKRIELAVPEPCFANRESDTRHFLYHLYPRRGGLWTFNVDLIVPHLNLFNGKKIVSIAVDETTDDSTEVIRRFGRDDISFVVRRNDPLHETNSFMKVLLPAVCNERGVTFYGHGKGSSHADSNLDFIAAWAQAMVYHNLRHEVPRRLEQFEAAGIYRRRMEHHCSSWHYSGTFFWFRNHAVFQRDWKNIGENRFGVEAFLGRLIPYESACCLFGENPPDLYSNRY